MNGVELACATPGDFPVSVIECVLSKETWIYNVKGGDLNIFQDIWSEQGRAGMGTPPRDISVSGIECV